MEAKTKTPPPSEQTAQCPACGGDGVRTVDTGGNVWQSPCPDCAGTGKKIVTSDK